MSSITSLHSANPSAVVRQNQERKFEFHPWCKNLLGLAKRRTQERRLTDHPGFVQRTNELKIREGSIPQKIGNVQQSWDSHPASPHLPGAWFPVSLTHHRNRKFGCGEAMRRWGEAQRVNYR